MGRGQPPSFEGRQSHSGGGWDLISPNQDGYAGKAVNLPQPLQSKILPLQTSAGSLLGIKVQFPAHHTACTQNATIYSHCDSHLSTFHLWGGVKAASSYARCSALENRMRETQKHEVFFIYFHFHKNFLRFTAVRF